MIHPGEGEANTSPYSGADQYNARMRRRFRIVGPVVDVVCLVLCLGFLVAWFSPRRMQRVFWWNSSGDLAHYHVATVQKAKLLLARYRETSVSPRDVTYLHCVAEEPQLGARIDECMAYLK